MSRIVFILLLLPAYLCAQSSGPVLPQITLKINPTTLINPFKPALALGADIRLSEAFTLDLSAGAFLGSSLYATYKGESYAGLRFRGGFKYFYRFREKAAFHLGAELKYNDISNKTFQNALRQGGNYAELLLTNRQVSSYGAAFRVGAQFFNGKNRRLVIEPYAGLGMSLHRVSTSVPADAALLNDQEEAFSFQYPEGTIRVPDLLLGLWVGYALW